MITAGIAFIEHGLGWFLGGTIGGAIGSGVAQIINAIFGIAA